MSSCQVTLVPQKRKKPDDETGSNTGASSATGIDLVSFEAECQQLLEHRACRREFEAMSRETLSTKAILDNLMQERIECKAGLQKVEESIARWKRKTQTFYLGQPKTKKMYKANWEEANECYVNEVARLKEIDGRFHKYEAKYRQALSNCSNGLVRLAASAADCGGIAAELCLSSSLGR